MTEVIRPKVLLIGFGNPSRLDDGIGPKLADAVEKLHLPNLFVDSNYQLTVEDASNVADYDYVILADASVNAKEPFEFYKLEPKLTVEFSTHSVEPASVIGLAHKLFDSKVKGFALAIRGYDFNDFGEELSVKAADNVLDAITFVKKLINENQLLNY